MIGFMLQRSHTYPLWIGYSLGCSITYEFFKELMLDYNSMNFCSNYYYNFYSKDFSNYYSNYFYNFYSNYNSYSFI